MQHIYPHLIVRIIDLRYFQDKPRLLSDTPVGAGEDDEESAGEMTDGKFNF
jgi:hypothetical protein